MKWFIRGLSASLLCVGIVGVLGCGPDNDTEANRLAKSIGDPGKPDPKGVPATLQPAANTQEELRKQQQQLQNDMFKRGGNPTKK
ncbi:MAG: hypothetical protein ACLQIB_13840 [Isosphaeraceae bacterium]